MVELKDRCHGHSYRMCAVITLAEQNDNIFSVERCFDCIHQHKCNMIDVQRKAVIRHLYKGGAPKTERQAKAMVKKAKREIKKGKITLEPVEEGEE